MKWTTEQQDVFKQDGTLLVSASAGSGKTTVMVKCIADVLTKSVPIESVVVMSYTVASAADMRQKIIDKLYRYAQTGTDDDGNTIDVEHVRKQIDNIPFAEISTVDAFCAREIRRNFQTLGIDPTFRQLDDIETEQIKNAVMSGLLEELREKGDERELKLFARMDGAGDALPGGLKPLLIRLYDSISLHINPDEYVAEIRGSGREGALRAKYEKIITRYYTATAADLYEMFKSIGGFPDERWQLWYDTVLEFAKALKGATDFDSLRRAIAYMPNINAPRGNADIDVEAKNIAMGIRSTLKALATDIESVLASSANDDGADELIDAILDIVEEFYARYSRKKADAVALDFNDLSRYAIRLLSDDARAAEIRSRISHVFVDEYQDVNALQEYIVTRIATDGKLFMVGDSKQSIYAFRNADTQIFLDKAAAFESGEKVGINRRLTQNFRSTKRILEFNDRLFSQIMVKWLSGVDYAEESRFLNENTDMTADNLKDDGAEVSINFLTMDGASAERIKGIYSVENAVCGERLTKEYAEGKAAAEKIHDIVGNAVISDGGKLRKLAYGDIAILLRSRSPGARQFIRGLRDGGVPYVTDGFDGHTGENVRKTLVNLLRVIDNSQNDIPFAGYMLSYFGGFTENELLEIKQSHVGLPVYGAVRAESESGKYADRCRAALMQIEKWRARSSYNDVGSLLTYVVTESGYDAYVLSKPTGRAEYAALNLFLTSLTGHTAAGDVGSFLRYFDGTRRPFEDSPALEFSDSVHVMTVHASKGLEFPVVFVCLTNEKSGGKGASPDLIVDRDLGIGVKIFDDEERAKRNSLAYTAITLNAKLKAAAENVRLLYVALTRAEKYLYVSGTVSNKAAEGGLRQYKPLTELKSFSDFIFYAAMRDTRIKLLIGEATEVSEDGAEREEALPAVVFNAPDEVYARAFDKVLNYKYPYAAATEISPKYTVTELNRMEEDVSAYLPSLYVTDGRARGIAYHTVMENVDFCLDTVGEVEDAIAAMVRSGVLMAEDAALVSAEEILKCITNPIIREGIKERYYREQSFMLNLPANEVLATDATDNVLIQGTIDLLLFGKENVVIDFKSSGAMSDTLRERYKKQLNVYVSAVEAVFRVKIDKRYLYSFREGQFLEL